jgi:hypothetical protein
MKMYEIVVPHNEIFHYWEDDGMLWHVKDPEHTHPRFDTRSEEYKATLFKWKSGEEPDYTRGPWLPTTLVSAGFWLIDNNPKEIQAFARWCVEAMEERRVSLGDDQNYIFAHRSHGDKLEITYFIHPKTTNRPVHWIG